MDTLCLLTPEYISMALVILRLFNLCFSTREKHCWFALLISNCNYSGQCDTYLFVLFSVLIMANISHQCKWLIERFVFPVSVSFLPSFLPLFLLPYLLPFLFPIVLAIFCNIIFIYSLQSLKLEDREVFGQHQP